MTDKERRNKLKALIYLERALALDEKHFFFQLIDDEDLILSLEALESSANDAMEALFLQTGGGY